VPTSVPRFVRDLLCAALVVGLAIPAAAHAAPEPSASASAPVIWGVNTANAPDDGSKLDAVAAEVGEKPAMVMWYQSWKEPIFYSNQIANVTARDETPLITWMPSTDAGGIPLRDIVNGAWDSYIRQSATSAKNWGRPLYLRFGHEMNLISSSWGAHVNGNTPADFVAAWRHVVQIFRDTGASNVKFVWSPNVDWGNYPFAAFYPGDDWVDWVGLDGYNWGGIGGSRWRSFNDVFASSYDTLTALSSKPVMIAETAAPEATGDKPGWIRSGLEVQLPTRMPKVRAVIWFDRDKETDWRIGSSPATLDAFKEAIASPVFRGESASVPDPAPPAGVTRRIDTIRPVAAAPVADVFSPPAAVTPARVATAAAPRAAVAPKKVAPKKKTKPVPKPKKKTAKKAKAKARAKRR
jgi:glycosyl hydrolase family 26